VALLASKWASQPELCLRVGKMCLSTAPCGIYGDTGRRVVCMLVMVEPSVRWTVMSCVMGLPCVRLTYACR
jgi:hypothetical protein